MEGAVVEFPSIAPEARVSAEIRRIAEDARYTMVVRSPAEVRFSVRICEQPVLRFAVGEHGCDGKGSYQIWLSSEEQSWMVYKQDVGGGNPARWIEGEVDLSAYTGRLVLLTFKTEGASYLCDYLWADPVLIARKGLAARPPVIVSGVKLQPDRVPLGGEYLATFYGPALTEATHFDLRVRAPKKALDEIVVDWQKGISGRHPIPPVTEVGTWIITGVRAHEGPSNHDGDFHPVWTALEVTR
jgi:hypothetical protein